MLSGKGHFFSIEGILRSCSLMGNGGRGDCNGNLTVQNIYPPLF